MTAAKCLRQYAYDVQASHGPKVPKGGATLIGSMLHLMMAHHYVLKAFAEGAQEVRACDRVLTRADIPDILSPQGALWEFTYVRDVTGQAEGFYQTCLDTYAAYVAKYRDERNWEVVAVEWEYEATLPGLPEELSLYTQRADLVVRDRQTGKVYFVDHKKAYEVSTKTAAQYILHGQFLGYARLGKKYYGANFGGSLLNRIIPTDAKGGAKFVRSLIEPAPAAVAAYVGNVVMIEKLIAFTETLCGPAILTADGWPASYSEEVCYGKYGRCKHFERCRYGAG